MAIFEIVNCAFNRANYRDLINQYTGIPPAYAIVRRIEPYRKHTCWECDKQWMAKVEMANQTQMLTGETSQYCPECYTKASCSTAWINADGSDWVFPPPFNPDEKE